jgi:hypothetical protein
MECPPLKGAMGDDKLCLTTRIKVISKLIGHPSRGFGFSKNLNLLLRSLFKGGLNSFPTQRTGIYQ